MATIDKETAIYMIANNGRYADDQPCSKIVAYDNAFGGRSYAIVYPHEDQMRYENSPACANVETLWSNK